MGKLIRKFTIFVIPCLIALVVIPLYYRHGYPGTVQYALYQGNAQKLDKLLSQNPEVKDSFTYQGKGILLTAINWKRLAGRDELRKMSKDDLIEWELKACGMVEVLIKHGVDITQHDNRALDEATSSIFMPILAKLLLDNGADPNVLAPNIVNCGEPDFISMLFEYGVNGDFYLSTLVRDGYYGKEGILEIAKILLENGCSIDDKDFYGMSALGYAKKQKNEKLINLLDFYSKNPPNETDDR